VTNPARARERIDAQITYIARLRGTGPNPFDYDQWDDRTTEVLVALFGRDSEELAAYEEAAGKKGRLPGVRGIGENMTLNIHGPWGIKARLDRAEAVLNSISAKLAQQ
jgi:hypothetical protein